MLPAETAEPVGGLVGQVRDQVSGRPLVRMTVSVRREPTLLVAAASGGDEVQGPQGRGTGEIPALGRFEFTNVPAGPVTLVVTSPHTRR